jgi:hypothetical protein
MAKNPVSFFICININRDDNFEGISFENVKTNEKLVIKTKVFWWKLLLIMRYPLNAAKNWIEANEEEISEYNRKLDRKIIMDEELSIEM